MSTFFEKLTTASHPKASGDAATADLGTVVRHAPAMPPKLAAPIHEKNANPEPPDNNSIAQETPSPVPEENMNTTEEEGELTVDIYDHNDTIVIQSTVAGVKPEDLEVSITSDMVSIKGTRRSVDHVSEDHYYYKELFWGTFSRTVILPEEIDEHHTEAVLKHGLLTITLPKKKKGLAHAQKVKIKTV
ncbi:MAG: Hsp20/alpha crystallin family protein [Candidatus Sungbacteria bacterium]|nr:Hsp20/alpha crystallin family protein [Candidatus Sungbacteria bacterium]